MSPWILVGLIVAGALFLTGLGFYLTHGYDYQGEPMEYRDHWQENDQP
tara:strand:+ start:599 stop:742 length:144 start_codon:yes stop_codon:yes gene_type:complete